MKSSMVDVSTIEDPWTELGLDIPKNLREPLRKLKEAGDEAETRIAWMEHIAEAGDCPVCLAPLGMVERRTGLNFSARKNRSICRGRNMANHAPLRHVGAIPSKYIDLW